MIYTNVTLWNALRELIPNLPSEGVNSLTLRMTGGDCAPTLELVVWPAPKLGDTSVKFDSVKRFYLVDEKNWEQTRKFLAFTENELRRMS